MKTVKAKFELSEAEIKDILAMHLWVNPSDICFKVVQMQRDDEYVTAIITKEIDIPVNSVESAYEHYCPNNL